MLGGEREPARPTPLPDLPFTSGERGSSDRAGMTPVPPEAPGPEAPAATRQAPTPPRPPPPAPQTPPPSVEQLAESISTRLTEDETLRGGLSDEEFQPLLDWAVGRIGELATSCRKLPPASGAAELKRASDQLVKLLQTVDVAIGQRSGAAPTLVASRFQMLDTLLEPPLVDRATATRARARLEAILAQPARRLQSTDGAELTRQLADALG